MASHPHPLLILGDMVLAKGATLRLKWTIIPILARDNCPNWTQLMTTIN